MANPPVSSPQQSGFSPNLLTNPGFEQNQRGQASYTGSGGFTLDKWQLGGAGGGHLTISQDGSTVMPGSKYSAKLVYDGAAGNSPGIYQTFGALTGTSLSEDSVPLLYGQTVTFAIWVYSTVSGCTAIAQQDNQGTLATLGTSAPSRLVNTWERVVLTTTISATSLTNVVFELKQVDGTAMTTWVDNAVLVVGSQPVPYVPLHPADDLLRCQRYYERIGYPGDGTLNWTGYMPGSNQAYAPIFYKVEKPVVPTYTIVGSWNFINVSGSAFNSHTPGLTTANLAWLTNTAGTYTVYNQSGAYLTLEANP